ncbi:Cytochrome b-c1 complex subunit Rieske [Thelohanellus kitauei]|uniref:Cytochrome b-c1 complex subunit Rieske, mitochondrial n=1 Tax=Thelohanellus kitauei TaxID=669202 RepID=A0A0C2MMI5_THEKT|nr:Cytochrome b-c1 complex subunit Rieske [Thelohanellus kitauei]
MFLKTTKYAPRHKFVASNLEKATRSSVRWSYAVPEIKPFADAQIKHITPCFAHKNKFLSRNVPVTAGYSWTRARAGGCFTRYAHTDIKFPGYQEIRLDNEPHKDGPHAFYNQRYLYTSTLVASMATCVAVKETCDTFIQSFMPQDIDKYQSMLEFDLNKVPYGTSFKAKWKKKPLYITHLSDEDIEEAKAVPLSALVDPQTLEDRTPVNPRYLVMVGICTHLGCVPHMKSGDYNGFFCACHGSHYDKIGRIRAGPAPRNLEVPKYRIDEQNILHID